MNVHDAEDCKDSFCPSHLPMQLQQKQEQGDDAERLPNDLYASQGGKAAVNELLASKMQQVSQLSKKIAYIRDLVGGYSDKLAQFGAEDELSGRHRECWDDGVAEGERRMAFWVLDILNKADGYDD